MDARHDDEGLKLRPLVLLPVANRRSFLRYYEDDPPAGVVWVPGFTRLPLDTRVDVGVSFGKEGLVLQARGAVRARHLSGRVGRPRGIAVELLPSESRARDLLVGYATGAVDLPAIRTAWRYPAMLAVAQDAGAREAGATTDDLSLGGASIVTARPPPDVGATVKVCLRPPAAGPIAVTADVRWRDEQTPARFGVRFHLADFERERMSSVIAAIRHAMALAPAVVPA